jgi:pyridoxine/pyridoxamine 5'-phosphate oxidase
MHQENRETQLKLLYEFISQHKLGVLATVTGDALPEAAVVGIAVTNNLEIICSTYDESRKHQNILKNPDVALVIGWEHGKTVQYEGVATVLSKEESQEHFRTTFANVPTIAKHLTQNFEVMYKITPKWIRYSDFSRDPWDQFEVTF